MHLFHLDFKTLDRTKVSFLSNYLHTMTRHNLRALEQILTLWTEALTAVTAEAS